jgi:hypothetical protein
MVLGYRKSKKFTEEKGPLLTMTNPTHAIGYLYEYNGLWEDPDLFDFGDGYYSNLPLDPRKCQLIQMGECLPPQGWMCPDDYEGVWFVSQTILPNDACIRGELTLHLASQVREPIVHEWVMDDWVDTLKGDMWQMVAVPHCPEYKITDMFVVTWTHIEIEYERVMKRGKYSLLPIEDICK